MYNFCFSCAFVFASKINYNIYNHILQWFLLLNISQSENNIQTRWYAPSVLHVFSSIKKPCFKIFYPFIICTSHQHNIDHMGTFQVYWWRNTSGASLCVITGTNGHLSRTDLRISSVTDTVASDTYSLNENLKHNTRHWNEWTFIRRYIYK
jgi:hypothetical protein